MVSVTRRTRRTSLILGVLLALFLIPNAPQRAVASTHPSTPSLWVELRLFDYGHWEGGSETPSSVLSTIGSIRSAAGGTPVNLFGIIRDLQVNDQSVGGGYTLDSFLSAAKAAAGGDIVPDLNLDVYTNDQGMYCDPKQPSFCGPAFFYATSAEMLTLTAVQKGSKTVFLESWDTFVRETTAATRQQVFQELIAQGWNRLVIHQIGPGYFNDPGMTWGQASNVVHQSTSPYMVPDTSMVNQVPTNEVALVHFDRQNKATASGETSLQYFMKSTADQQATALTNLASSESRYGYVFVYPVMTYTGFMGKSYLWDAAKNLQSNGKPFLSLIESLIAQYK